MINVFSDLPAFGHRGGDIVYAWQEADRTRWFTVFLNQTMSWSNSRRVDHLPDPIVQRCRPETAPEWFDAAVHRASAAGMLPLRALDSAQTSVKGNISEELIDSANAKQGKEYEEMMDRATDRGQCAHPAPLIAPAPPGDAAAAGWAPTDPAAGLLTDALNIVTDARRKSYGNPEDNFPNISELCKAFDLAAKRCGTYGQLEANGTLVAIRNILQKLARIAETPDHRDSWLDIAGYSACGYRCATAPSPKVEDHEDSPNAAL